MNSIFNSCYSKFLVPPNCDLGSIQWGQSDAQQMATCLRSLCPTLLSTSDGQIRRSLGLNWKGQATLTVVLIPHKFCVFPILVFMQIQINIRYLVLILWKIWTTVIPAHLPSNHWLVNIFRIGIQSFDYFF